MKYARKRTSCQITVFKFQLHLPLSNIPICWLTLSSLYPYFLKNIFMYNHLFPGVSTDLCLQLLKLKQELKSLEFYPLISKNQMASTCETVTILHSDMNPVIHILAAAHGALLTSHRWGGVFKRHTLSGWVWLLTLPLLWHREARVGTWLVTRAFLV